MRRTYSELIQLPTLEERYHYLALRGEVGDTTFGSERWMNQSFYKSREWRQLRHAVIARDNGSDLGVEGFEIHSRLIIHHMNPMSVDEVRHGEAGLLDPEVLITTCHRTHNAIHYGAVSQLPRVPVERRPGDTIPWKV